MNDPKTHTHSRINWKAWRLGLAVSLLLSLLVAGAGLTEGMSWRAFTAVFCAAAVTHLGAFLYRHPVEEIEWEQTTMNLVLVVSLVCGILTFAACKYPPQRLAYNTIATELATVNSSYAAYVELVLLGKVKTNDFPKVTRAYETFQKSAQIAIELANFNTNAIAPPSVSSNSWFVLRTIQEAH